LRAVRFHCFQWRGKTTTIKFLAGIFKPSSEVIHIDDVDIKQDAIRIKNIIGDIPDRPVLYHKLTGWKYPDFIAGLYLMDQDVAREKAGKFFSFFDLQDSTDELIEGYSHSMRQKLVIAGVFQNPKVVIVYKPLVGLGPKGARQVKQLFQDLFENGTTIFMSTHS
jgi:ABC-2 type transport system ATP-binding protein